MPKRPEAKSRIWLFVFYPDSAPKNWEEVIESWMLPVAVSPLHDSDVNKDGEVKKAHWHGIAEWDGPTTYSRAMSYFEQLGCSIAKICDDSHKVRNAPSRRTAVRYLCHLDSPSKIPYDISKVKTFGGFDVSCLYYDTEDGALVNDLQFLVEYCERNGIIEFADLVNEVCTKFPEYLGTLTRQTTFFRGYLQSRRAYADNVSYVKLRKKVGRYSNGE